MSSPVLFNPDPATTDRILQALADPARSFAATAAANSITIEALSLWIARPDILPRLAALESTAAWHTRFLATLHLHHSITALTQVLNHPTLPTTPPASLGRQHSELRTYPSASPPPLGTRDSELRTSILQVRAFETVRKAATTILQLTRFRPLDFDAPPISASTHRASSSSAAAPSPRVSAETPPFRAASPKQPAPSASFSPSPPPPAPTQPASHTPHSPSRHLDMASLDLHTLLDLPPLDIYPTTHSNFSPSRPASKHQNASPFPSTARLATLAGAAIPRAP